MSTRTLSYFTTVTSTGILDGEVQLTPPIKFNPQMRHSLRVLRASIPSHIPNVFNYGGINNGLIRVSRDAGANWTVIQLSDGVYSVRDIQEAINYNISAWYTTSTDPALALEANGIVQKCYFLIDNTKLAAGGTDLWVDLNYNSSMIYDLLGFTVATSLLKGSVASQFDATNYAKMDYQGNSVRVRISGFGPLTIKNGLPSEEIITINLDTGSGTNTYSWPGSSGELPFYVTCRVSEFLPSFNVYFIGRDNLPIKAFDGSCDLLFEVVEHQQVEVGVRI